MRFAADMDTAVRLVVVHIDATEADDKNPEALTLLVHLDTQDFLISKIILLMLIIIQIFEFNYELHSNIFYWFINDKYKI